MTLAAEARDAVRERPFLLEALRAGVVNYTAAARHLDVGEEDAVATALRRFAEDLPDRDPTERAVRVTMESGLERVDGGEAGGEGDGSGGGGGESALLSVGDAALAPGSGDLTGVLATGSVDPEALSWALDRLLASDVPVEAAGVAGEAVLVVVPRRAGADAVRVVEDALEGVPRR